MLEILLPKTENVTQFIIYIGSIYHEIIMVGSFFYGWYSFNEFKCTSILCTLRHPYISIDRFAFNYYLHHIQLIVREPDGTSGSILGCKGVIQGYPLSMVVYGIVILCIIKDLQNAVPDIHQPWYVYDSSIGG